MVLLEDQAALALFVRGQAISRGSVLTRTPVWLVLPDHPFRQTSFPRFCEPSIGEGEHWLKTTTSIENICERAIGKCPSVNVKLGGVDTTCLLDTGSEVSTITEEHFNLHFRPKGTELLSTAGWLTLTAANGQEIPYVGYFELDVEGLDNTLRRMGILVVKNPTDERTKQRKQKVPGLLGMNIIGKLGEDLSEENGRNYLQGVEPIWAQALQAGKRMNSSTRGLIRVAGRTPVRVPAGSVATIQATGWRGQDNEEHPMAIAEPLAGYHQPGRIILVNTLVRPTLLRKMYGSFQGLLLVYCTMWPAFKRLRTTSISSEYP